MMDARLRRGLLGLCFLATLLAVYLAPPGEPAGPEAPVRVDRPARSAGGTPRPAYGAAGKDLFASRSWRPAPPPEATVAAPRAPQAPPLPYVYTGRLDEAGQSVLILSLGQRVVLARQGDVLDGAWRVDRVTPWSIDFTYLPLKQAQSLNFAQ